MAITERRPERRPDATDGRGPRPRRRLTAEQAAQRAVRQIASFTGKDPETITAISRTADGWSIGIEVIEDRRIPSSSDILANYETQLDADGELVSYRRRARYARGRGSAEGPPS